MTETGTTTAQRTVQTAVEVACDVVAFHARRGQAVETMSTTEGAHDAVTAFGDAVQASGRDFWGTMRRGSAETQHTVWTTMVTSVQVVAREASAEMAA